jgi:hypothetical protein
MPEMSGSGCNSEPSACAVRQTHGGFRVACQTQCFDQCDAMIGCSNQVFRSAVAAPWAPAPPQASHGGCFLHTVATDRAPCRLHNGRPAFVVTWRRQGNVGRHSIDQSPKVVGRRPREVGCRPAPEASRTVIRRPSPAD